MPPVTSRARVTTLLMTPEWIAEEQRLWNAMMYPRRRKITTHSVPKDSPQRNMIRLKILLIQSQEFSEGWKNYGSFIRHMPA